MREEKKMYSVGDYVVYGDSDICKVTEIGVPELHRKTHTDRQFYFLETQFYRGMIYAPVDTQVSMRPVISREEALKLIDRMPEIQIDVSTLSDKKRLAEHYDALMAPHTSESLARTAKTIYEKYHSAGAKAKLPNSTEAMYYKKANELLLQELSLALEEEISEVQRRIEEKCALTHSITKM